MKKWVWRKKVRKTGNKTIFLRKKVLLFMGNCESLSETATSSVTMRSGSVSDGSEEAAIMYSNGMVTGSKVSV